MAAITAREQKAADEASDSKPGLLGLHERIANKVKGRR